MRFSRKTDYGVILLQELRGTFYSREFKPLFGIAAKNNLPPLFLAKLAETLRQKKFLEARRGPAGGYRLRRDPRRITFKELVEIFEEPPLMRCLKSRDPKKYCALAGICPSRKSWGRIQARMNRIFTGITLDKI